jgi:hypothetical protein
VIGSDGTKRNKAEVLSAMKDRKYESTVEEDIKVSVSGYGAVATGIWILLLASDSVFAARLHHPHQFGQLRYPPHL